MKILTTATFALSLLTSGLATLPQNAFANDNTRALQQALLDKGFDPNGIDGALGAGTKKAFRAFWQAQGLSLSSKLLNQSTIGYFSSVVQWFDPKRLKELQATKAGEFCKEEMLAAAAALKPYGVDLAAKSSDATTQVLAGKLPKGDPKQEGHPMILLLNHSLQECSFLGAWRGGDGKYLYENGSFVYPWRRTPDRKNMEISARLVDSSIVLKSDQGTHSFAVKGF